MIIKTLNLAFAQSEQSLDLLRYSLAKVSKLMAHLSSAWLTMGKFEKAKNLFFLSNGEKLQNFSTDQRAQCTPIAGLYQSFVARLYTADRAKLKFFIQNCKRMIKSQLGFWEHSDKEMSKFI